MKKLRCLIALLLCAFMLFQLVGCGANDDAEYDEEYEDDEVEEKVNGATVFRALKKQVDFDSELDEAEDAEDLFEDLPDGSEVTLLTGPEEYSDQLGMIQVEDEEDLDDAEESVNDYLQSQYDYIADEYPEEAEKFENVAIWKNEVYIVFCITINYTNATQIIDDTVSGEESQPEDEETENVADNSFSGRWEITGYPAMLDAYEEQGSEPMFLDISFSASDVTVSLFAVTVTSDSYEITEVNGYPCLLVDSENEEWGEIGFVLINPDMLGFIHTDVYDGDITQQIQGTEYTASFEPLFNIYMREGSGTADVEQYMDVDAIREYGDWDEDDKFYYYPTSNILQVFVKYSDSGLYCDGAFYVYDDGSIVYMEEIALPWGSDLPADTIDTDHNFVIADCH